uniref:Uncharacterized protein n=1 Tax=viral metagenome TaxID=1070528 RepID=A0A6C0L280_9ZZZZ|tara:strand:- start:3527 stop:4312 length:786 start_codon:yes stop_codon:yes gene_type:complete
MKSPLIVLLRGHERNSFKTNKLKDFINLLIFSFKKENIEIKIYIHTWTNSEASISWRNLDIIPQKISKEEIISYFDVHIDNIIIDDEKKAKLIGNIDGKIGNIPILCWKRMWYGQYIGMKHIIQNWNKINHNSHTREETPIVLNIRMDFFSCNTTKKYKLTHKLIIQMTKKAYNNPEKIGFLFDNGEYDGIDNVFVGFQDKMYELIRHFHFDLDNIYPKYNYLLFHESMVYYESEILFSSQTNFNELFWLKNLLVRGFNFN